MKKPTNKPLELKPNTTVIHSIKVIRNERTGGFFLYLIDRVNGEGHDILIDPSTAESLMDDLSLYINPLEERDLIDGRSKNTNT